MIQVAWWHRLIIVLIGAGLLLLAPISLWLAYEESKDTRIAYSWREPMDDSTGSPCSVFIHQSPEAIDISCGDLEDPTAILDDMGQHGYIRAQFIPKPRTKLNDAYALEAVLKAKPAKANYVREFAASNAGKPFGIAALVIFGYLAIATLLFRTLLWIVHGTTEIAR